MKVVQLILNDNDYHISRDDRRDGKNIGEGNITQIFRLLY